MTKQQPRVAVIGTGGTISSVGRDGLDIVRYVEIGKIYEVDELLKAFPETLEQADVEALRTWSEKHATDAEAAQAKVNATPSGWRESAHCIL